MSDAREKARKLIALALDDRGNERERLSAAMRACVLIKQHDLLASPLDGILTSDNETVKAAVNIGKAVAEDGPAVVRGVKSVVDAFKKTRARR